MRSQPSVPVSALRLMVVCGAMAVPLIAGQQRAPSATLLDTTPARTNGVRTPIRNHAPRFVFSDRPSILVLIDGKPVYRSVEGTDLRRIINTKPFIVGDSSGLHYLKVFDGWMEAYGLDGWSVSGVAPEGAEQALQEAVAAKTVDVLDGATPATADTPHLDDDTAPSIIVSQEPAELIVTDGPARFAALAGTPLQYVENTTAHVFKEPTDHQLYVLAAGRWFRAWTTHGPWQFVSSRELPADLIRIPNSSPNGFVRASIAGTPEARAALDANAVARTATINRARTKLAPLVVDGEPELQAIADTGLSYVVNSPTPIVTRVRPRHALPSRTGSGSAPTQWPGRGRLRPPFRTRFTRFRPARRFTTSRSFASTAPQPMT